MLEVNNLTKQKINCAKLKSACAYFVKFYKMPWTEVSLAIVDDKIMQQLNKRYRGQNKATDVLSFGGVNEIIIDYEQIVRQAAETKTRPASELLFIFVHGLLHLLGDDDKTEAGRLRMIKKGQDFIARL